MNWMGGAKYRESFHAKNRTRMKKFMQQRKQQQKRFFDQIQQENANISSITVTATSIYDKTKKGTASITVA